MKKIFFFLSLSLIFIFPKHISAYDYCNFTSGGNITFNNSCVVYEDVNGVADGDLIITPGTAITLHKTLVFPPSPYKIVIQDTETERGIIYINTSGKIAQGKLCVKDADLDGVPDPINITTDPYGNTLKLDSPITQIQMVLADQTTNLCPDATWTYRENISDMTIADADVNTPTGTYATSDRELLRMGFAISGVTDTLAAAGDIQTVNRNLLICAGAICPENGLAGLSPATGNLYTGGKIGIGTTSPNTPLTIFAPSANSSAIQLINGDSGSTGSDGLWIDYHYSGGAEFWNTENTPMWFATGGNERLRITANGNVGIGTASPEAILDVVGSFNASYGNINLNSSSIYATNINTGTSTGAISIGGGSNTVAVNSSNWDVSSAGAATGLTGLTSSGTITFSGITANRLVSTTTGGKLTTTITSANVRYSISDETGTGVIVTNNGPTFTTGSVVFSGISSDIITGTNQHFAIMPNGTGNVGIGTTAPTYKIHVVGSLYAGGSSKYYKENIVPMVLDSSRIYELEPKTYDYKEKYKQLGKSLSGGRQFGLIAEEVFKVYPELTLSDGTRNVANVDYEKLGVLLLAEMKNHKKEIDSLKIENQQLKNRLNNLELRLQELENSTN